MCREEETKIGGICSCLCTELTPEERALIKVCLKAFQVYNEKMDQMTLTGREIFVLCEFFARKGSDLWHWGSLRTRPNRSGECILSEDCLDLYGDQPNRAFLKTWLRIYLHEFFEPRESLPGMRQTFVLKWSKLRALLDFFLHHGGCLTNKYIYSG